MKAHLHPSLVDEQKNGEDKKGHIYLDSLGKFERYVLLVEGSLALRFAKYTFIFFLLIFVVITNTSLNCTCSAFRAELSSAS